VFQRNAKHISNTYGHFSNYFYVLLSQGIVLVLYITAKLNVLSVYKFTESTTKHTSQTHMWHVVF